MLPALHANAEHPWSFPTREAVPNVICTVHKAVNFPLAGLHGAATASVAIRPQPVCAIVTSTWSPAVAHRPVMSQQQGQEVPFRRVLLLDADFVRARPAPSAGADEETIVDGRSAANDPTTTSVAKRVIGH